MEAVLDASPVRELAPQAAQRLLNELSKMVPVAGMTVAGAFVVATADQVYVLWIRDDFACPGGPYPRVLFDRASRTVFGVEG